MISPGLRADIDLSRVGPVALPVTGQADRRVVAFLADYKRGFKDSCILIAPMGVDLESLASRKFEAVLLLATVVVAGGIDAVAHQHHGSELLGCHEILGAAGAVTTANG